MEGIVTELVKNLCEELIRELLLSSEIESYGKVCGERRLSKKRKLEALLEITQDVCIEDIDIEF